MQKIVKLLVLFCRSKEQLNTRKGKKWSRGTNLRLSFAVNVALNVSINLSIIVVTLTDVGYAISFYTKKKEENQETPISSKKEHRLQQHQNLVKTH